MTSPLMIKKNDDKQLGDAVRTWLTNTDQWYENHAIAMVDLIELVGDWGQEWIRDADERN